MKQGASTCSHHGSVLDQGAPLITLQECGPKGSDIVLGVLGEDFEKFAWSTEDPVATFWDTKVAIIVNASRIPPGPSRTKDWVIG